MSQDNPTGINFLRDPSLNKGVCLSFSQRKDHLLLGLLPPLGSCIANESNSTSSEFLKKVCLKRLEKFTTDFDKHDWLMKLYDINHTLFFTLLSENLELLMPLVYTPTVGEACQNLSLVYRDGRGLFLTKHDNDLPTILRNWPEKNVLAICVTDGERILGLGDLGAFGMGIPVGKLSLYTGLAGIPPTSLLPLTLDVGTNNEKLRNDPLYFGLREPRVTGADYDKFIDNVMKACVEVFGKHVLIQFEDFANHNAFRLMKKYQNDYCSFNDDIQGTASVVLAGVLASTRLTNRQLKDQVIVCYGAGEAAIGFAHLVVRSIIKEIKTVHPNNTEDEIVMEAKNNIYLVDSKGLVVKNRPSGGLTEAKLEFARPDGTPCLKSLTEVIEMSKCTCLIGASAMAGAFTTEILELMMKFTKNPVIMALSNPTSKSECTAEQAYSATKGQCIFASGSPFSLVDIEVEDPNNCGSKIRVIREPGQANNAYIFPAIALAIIAARISPVTEQDFLVAAEHLSLEVNQKDLDIGRLYPHISEIRRVSYNLARAVILSALSEGRCHGNIKSETVDTILKRFSYYPSQ